MGMRDTKSQLGRVIGGRYRVIGWLGEGGHGWVYEALDTVEDTLVAVKVVKSEHASENARARLEHEASASRRVSHPCVARIIAVGEDDGDAFVAMELVKGPTLRAWRAPGEVLSPKAIAEVFVPLADAVAAVHRAGLVHRDLKPSNVGLVIDEDDRPSPRLLDFGTAKAIEGDASTTTSGRIVGTPHYMSPEQALGEPTNDPRVDVWALGVMLYECLEGQRPYGGASSTAVLMNILRLEPRPLGVKHRDTPLGRVVTRAMAHDIAQRFADAGALHDALVQALSTPEGAPHGRLPRARVRVFAAMATTGLVIAIGVLIAANRRPAGQVVRDVVTTKAALAPRATSARPPTRMRAPLDTSIPVSVDAPSSPPVPAPAHRPRRDEHTPRPVEPSREAPATTPATAAETVSESPEDSPPPAPGTPALLRQF